MGRAQLHSLARRRRTPGPVALRAGTALAAVSIFVTPLLPNVRDGGMTARAGVTRQASVAISRFAPSPTGRLHLGHAYSAVRAHDLARASGGDRTRVG